MEWLVIDEKYLNYLRDKESRIPKSDYGNDKYKPFFGVLFETDTFYYVTQVSHPKQKHFTMKANEDFKKIFDPKSNRLIAVINLNYMFPIPKTMYNKLQYKDLDKHRTFKNEIEKSKKAISIFCCIVIFIAPYSSNKSECVPVLESSKYSPL